MSEPDLPAVGTAEKRNVHKPMPSVLDIRARLLSAAGFNEPEQVQALQAVIQSALDDLAAIQETPVTHQGQITDLHRQANYPARGKAREQLLKLIGVEAVNQPTTPRQGPIIIAPPAWMKLTLEASNSPQEVSDTITLVPQPPHTEPTPRAIPDAGAEHDSLLRTEAPSDRDS